VRAVVTDYLGPALEAGDRPMFDLLLANVLMSLSDHAFEPDGLDPRFAVPGAPTIAV
jgi:hypothetical protein